MSQNTWFVVGLLASVTYTMLALFDVSLLIIWSLVVLAAVAIYALSTGRWVR